MVGVLFSFESSSCRDWSFISDEMFSSADAHRYDILPEEVWFYLLCVFISQVFFQNIGKRPQPRCYSGDASNLRWTLQKKEAGALITFDFTRQHLHTLTVNLVWTQLDNAIEKSGKLVLTNWNEQIKVRKINERFMSEDERILQDLIRNKPTLKCGIQKHFWGFLVDLMVL